MLLYFYYIFCVPSYTHISNSLVNPQTSPCCLVYDSVPHLSECSFSVYICPLLVFEFYCLAIILEDCRSSQSIEILSRPQFLHCRNCKFEVLFFVLYGNLGKL